MGVSSFVFYEVGRIGSFFSSLKSGKIFWANNWPSGGNWNQTSIFMSINPDFGEIPKLPNQLENGTDRCIIQQ